MQTNSFSLKNRTRQIQRNSEKISHQNNKFQEQFPFTCYISRQKQPNVLFHKGITNKFKQLQHGDNHHHHYFLHLKKYSLHVLPSENPTSIWNLKPLSITNNISMQFLHPASHTLPMRSRISVLIQRVHVFKCGLTNFTNVQWGRLTT